MAIEEQFKLKVTADTKTAVNAVGKLQQEFKDVDAQLKAIERAKALSKLAADAASATAKTGSSEKALERLNRQLEKAKASQAEAALAAKTYLSTLSQIKGSEVGGGGSVTGALGKTSSAASGVASVVSVFDQGSSQVARFTADVAGAVEKLPQFGDAAKSALSSLSPVGIAFTAVAAAVGIAVAQIIASQQDLNKQISASIQANADIERKIAEGLTVDQATAEIERLTKARQAELDIIAKEKESREQAANAAASQFGILSGAVLGFVNATSEAEQKSADVQQQSTDAAAQFQAEIDRLTLAIENGELATNEAIVAEQELAAERERTAAATADAIRLVSSALASGLDTEGLTAKIDETTAALEAEEEVRRRLTAAGQENTAAFETSLQRTESLTATLTELESATTVSAAAANTAAKEQELLAKEQLNAAASARDAAAAQALVAEKALEGIARAKAESDKAAAAREAAEKAHQDKLKAIAERGAKAIADAQADLLQKQIDAAKAIARAQADFAAESLKAQQNFEKERLRRQRDFELARKRLEEDFLNARFDAILNGDIAGAILAERDFKTTKKRNKQDFKTEEGDLAEDFAQEQAERAAALAQKIADIQTELAEYTAATLAKIAQIKLQTEQELAMEKAAYDQKVVMDTTATQAINANAQQASNLKLSFIQQEQSATATAHQNAATGINNVNTAAQRLIATALAAQRAASGGSATPPRTSQGGQGVRPFADGGIFTKPTVLNNALVGEAGIEGLIPLRELPRLMGGVGGMGGGSPQFNISVEVNATGTDGSPQDIGNRVAEKLKEAMPPILEEYTRHLIKGTGQT